MSKMLGITVGLALAPFPLADSPKIELARNTRTYKSPQDLEDITLEGWPQATCGEGTKEGNIKVMKMARRRDVKYGCKTRSARNKANNLSRARAITQSGGEAVKQEEGKVVDQDCSAKVKGVRPETEKVEKTASCANENADVFAGMFELRNNMKVVLSLLLVVLPLTAILTIIGLLKL